jgi:hypothetical protein
MSSEEELEKEYQRLVDLYRQAAVNRMDAEDVLKHDETKRAELADKAQQQPDNKKLQTELADADDQVGKDKDKLEERKKVENARLEERDAFRENHGSIAAKIDTQDEMRAERVKGGQATNTPEQAPEPQVPNTQQEAAYAVDPDLGVVALEPRSQREPTTQQQQETVEQQEENEIEPSTRSPGKSKVTQVAGMALAAHMAGNADVTLLNDYERIANPPAITQTYNPSDPYASCAPPGQLTDPTKPNLEDAHEQLDQNAEHLHHALEKSEEESADKNKRAGSIAPPTEESASELANKKTVPPRFDDHEPRWSR